MRPASVRNLQVIAVFLMAVVGFECRSAPTCATTIAELRALLADESFPLKWHETSMDDGKPLVLSFLERNGSLVLEFVKTGQGLWAESACIVCRKGATLEAQFAEGQARPGPAAGWAMQYTLAGGGKFTLTKVGADQLRIATTGWSGTFSSREKN